MNSRKLKPVYIRSRHPSHRSLRGALPKRPYRSVVRLGSTTSLEDVYRKIKNKRWLKSVVEINTPAGVRNSSSKLLMKRAFKDKNVKTAIWIEGNSDFKIIDEGVVFGKETIPFPIVAKSHFGSRGRGNTLLSNKEEMESFLKKKNPNNYIFEKYYNYVREYRLHVTEDGCFYTCRKMLKTDTEDSKKWFRNDENCVWIMEDSPSGNFDRPSNWKDIEKHCVKALKAVGLDIGACDVRVQSGKGKYSDNPDFIIVEINSAPSFGEVTLEKYKKELNRLIEKKYNERSS